MLSSLDETIKQLLVKKGAVDTGAIDITFEAPDREWSASLSKPTINLYLYDIRENHKLRGTEFSLTRDQNGIATRKKNASRIDISYLITVWTNDIADEHRLLWHVLATLFRYQELPEDILSEPLSEKKYPIVSACAQPDGLFNNPADFWSALDNEIKPSINYVVTLPLDTEMSLTAPMVKTRTLEFKPPDTDPESFIQVTGHVHKTGAAAQSISQAKILIKEVGITAMSDEHGYYHFFRLNPGQYTFQAAVPGKKPRDFKISIPGNNYDLEI